MGKFCDACGRAASRLIARGKSILRQRGRKKRAKSRIAKYSWDKQYYGLKLKSVSKDIDLDGDDVQEINCRDIFCGDHGDREKYLLTWAELFTFAICTRFSVSYITVQMYMMTNFGPALTFSLSTFIMICTCVPVQSAYIFLGNFTKRYFVRFWDCVPILKGLPFALIIYSIPMQIYNVYFAGQALYYISKLIRSGTIPWENCDFDGACDECTPMYGDHKNFTTKCCNTLLDKNCTFVNHILELPTFSTMDFWISIKDIHSINEDTDIESISECVGILFCLYISIFLFVMIGMKRFRHVLTRFISYSAIGMVPIITVILFYGSNIPAPKKDFSIDQKLSMPQFWSSIISHSIVVELPMEMVNFGSQSPVTTSPTAASVLLYVSIEVVTILIAVCLCVSFKLAQTIYKIHDNRCLILQGQIFIFVLIPDLISRWYLGYYILIVYFFFLFIWWMIGVIIKCTAIVDALVGQFPRMRMYRTAVSGILCSVMFSYNIYLRYEDLFEANYHKFSTQTPFITYTLLSTVALGIFIYSPERIAVDYQFVHKIPLHAFVIYGIKMYIVIAFTVWITLDSSEIKEQSLTVRIVVLLPIIIGAIFVVIQYFAGYRSTIITPSYDWGPKNSTIRMDRGWFDPTHHFIFDTREKLCKHKCAATHANLSSEVEAWKNKLQAHEYSLNNQLN